MILAKLRLIARARTEADYEENVKNFKSSEEWKTNPKLRNWIGNTWLSQYKAREFYNLLIISFLQCSSIITIHVDFVNFLPRTKFIEMGVDLSKRSTANSHKHK